MDETNSKTIMTIENHITWMKIIRKMKYLDECGT
jgi:hypothetical protein